MTKHHPAVPGALAALLLLPSAAHAWDPVPERPDTPSLSAAGEDGVMSMWRNPANLAFDQDPSYAILYSQTLDETAGFNLSGARNLGPLGVGASYRSNPAGEGWWTVSNGLGLMLGRHMAIGTHLGWQIPEGADNNFLSWDVGIGWRPLSWMGFAAVAQNIGDPAPDQGVESKYGGGVVLRPFGDRLYLGADYLFTGIFSRQNGQTTADPEGLYELTLRAKLIDGLVVRGYYNQENIVGAGMEMNFGRQGAGAFAQAGISGEDTPRAMIYNASSDDNEMLFGSGRRVAGFLVDEAYPYQPSVGLFGVRSGESYMSLLNRIHAAAEDPSVKGLFIHLQRSSFSLAQIQELRSQLTTARAQGKSVVVYLDRSTSNAAYMLACAADKVYLHPAADLNLVGLSAELQFYAGALDMVGVEAQYARRAEYKSAPEQYLGTEASQANREQMNALLDQTFTILTEGIAEGRGRSADQIAAMVDEGPFTAEQALDKGLVDGLAYPDEMEDKIEQLIPKGNLSLGYGQRGEMQGWRAPNEIAVVYVDGVIVTGKSSQGGGLLGGGPQAGSDTIVRQLHTARRDPSVKAVVMRVDSPGGSAFASDEIWRAVEQLKKKGKPVIVSMGGTAASGGYYVAAGATAIYALPSTVTGSIGVYSGKFNVEGLYDKLGITVEQYTRGRNAAMYSLSRPMDESEYAAMDRMVARTYAQFQEKVRTGREMEQEEVDAVTRGRVWTGVAAQENGLVDELGGFHDAVSRARVEAGIRPRAEAALISYSTSGVRTGELARTTVQAWLSPDLGVALPAELEMLHTWRALQQDAIWALMPYRLELN